MVMVPFGEIKTIEDLEKRMERARQKPFPESNYDEPIVVDHEPPKTERDYGIPIRFKRTTFETLTDDSASLRACKAYAVNAKKHIRNGAGLILMGGVGTGKTSAGIAILKDYVKNGGNSVHFVTCVDLIDSFYSMEASQRRDFEKMIRNVSLLMIDDFGAETSTQDWVSNKIESIIANRYNDQKATIITTNLNVNSMKQGYSQRLIDRLKASCKIITFEGGSKRKVIDEV